MTREEYADAFSMIRRQTNKMHCLTENLLQLCRLESGHQKMDSQPFNLSSLVTELVEEQKLLHPETEYQCHIALSITFTGDRQLLGQAITNLLNNAWKYGKGPICTNLSVIGGQICLFCPGSWKWNLPGTPGKNLGPLLPGGFQPHLIPFLRLRTWTSHYQTDHLPSRRYHHGQKQSGRRNHFLNLPLILMG